MNEDIVDYENTLRKLLGCAQTLNGWDADKDFAQTDLNSVKEYLLDAVGCGDRLAYNGYGFRSKRTHLVTDTQHVYLTSKTSSALLR